MMPSTDQHRWFTHHPHHPGLATAPHHPDAGGVATGATTFASSAGPGAHHPAINPYMEAPYIADEMDAYLHHIDGQSAASYYGINMQYRAHQRSLNGKFCQEIFANL